MPTRLQWTRLPAATWARDTRLLAAWDVLNAQRGNLPFLSAASVAAALEVFGSGREVLAAAQADGETVALVLLVPLGWRRWQTFQPSQLPLGAWVAAAHLRLHDLAQSLQHGPLGLCPVLSFTQVDPLLAPRESDAAAIVQADYIETAWIDVAGPFDAYWNARGKNLRQNMRKQRSKLAAEGIVVHTATLTSAADVAPALERYGVLESAGWKSAQGTAIHLDNAQGRYYRRLLENAAAAGEAVIYDCRFDGRTVAMNLCLRRGGTLVVLKTTYDESIQGYSPAFLLNQDAVEQVFAEGTLRRIEYYGRLMDWHTKWTGNKRTLYHLSAYRWPWLKRLATRRAAARAADTAAEPQSATHGA